MSLFSKAMIGANSSRATASAVAAKPARARMAAILPRCVRIGSRFGIKPTIAVRSAIAANTAAIIFMYSPFSYLAEGACSAVYTPDPGNSGFDGRIINSVPDARYRTSV